MTEQYLGWALVVGVALGGLMVWLILGRLSRRTDDVSPEERAVEARWVSRTIEDRGGVAPVALVDEVLGLHDEYLAGPPLEVRARLRREVPPSRQPTPALGSELAGEDRDLV